MINNSVHSSANIAHLQLRQEDHISKNSTAKPALSWRNDCMPLLPRWSLVKAMENPTRMRKLMVVPGKGSASFKGSSCSAQNAGWQEPGFRQMCRFFPHGSGVAIDINWYYIAIWSLYDLAVIHCVQLSELNVATGSTWYIPQHLLLHAAAVRCLHSLLRAATDVALTPDDYGIRC